MHQFNRLEGTTLILYESTVRSLQEPSEGSRGGMKSGYGFSY
jgi:hypothetical protein